MSTKRIDSLPGLIREGLRLRIECGCGRVVVLDPVTLLEASLLRGGSHQIAKVAGKMRCRACGGSPAHYGPA